MTAAGTEVSRLSRPARFVEAAAWVTAGLLVAGTLAFVVLVLAPYYANGLHLQPTGAVAGGAFDPKYLPPYNWGDSDTSFGPIVLGFARLDFAIMMVLAPFAEAVLYICVAVMWRRLSRLERGAGRCPAGEPVFLNFRVDLLQLLAVMAARLIPVSDEQPAAK